MGSRPVSARKRASWASHLRLHGLRVVVDRHDLVHGCPRPRRAAPTRPGRRAARRRAPAWRGRRLRPRSAPGWRTIRLALVRMPSSCARATPAFTPGLRPKSSALTIRARSAIGRAAASLDAEPLGKRERLAEPVVAVLGGRLPAGAPIRAIAPRGGAARSPARARTRHPTGARRSRQRARQPPDRRPPGGPARHRSTCPPTARRDRAGPGRRPRSPSRSGRPAASRHPAARARWRDRTRRG